MIRFVLALSLLVMVPLQAVANNWEICLNQQVVLGDNFGDPPRNPRDFFYPEENLRFAAEHIDGCAEYYGRYLSSPVHNVLVEEAQNQLRNAIAQGWIPDTRNRQAYTAQAGFAVMETMTDSSNRFYAMNRVSYPHEEGQRVESCSNGACEVTLFDNNDRFIRLLYFDYEDGRRVYPDGRVGSWQ